MMVPMAATVAGAEPETAPKNMQATTVTMPRAPVTLPIRESAMRTSRLERPPQSMMSPASRKKGRLSMVKSAILV